MTHTRAPLVRDARRKTHPWLRVRGGCLPPVVLGVLLGEVRSYRLLSFVEQGNHVGHIPQPIRQAARTLRESRLWKFKWTYYRYLPKVDYP